MPRLSEQLTESKIRTLSEPGLYADGGGLYLQVRPNSRSWIFRFTLDRRTRDRGLGPLTEVSLSAARNKAAECRAQLATGVDPIDHAAKLSAAPPAPVADEGPRRPFREAAEDYLADMLGELKSSKHKQQWRNTLEQYAYPVLGPIDVAQVQTSHVLAVLRPIWSTKRETASRVRSRIERILAREAVEGRRNGVNPATWKGHLKEALSSRRIKVIHHAAVPLSDLPVVYEAIGKHYGVGPVALQFLILTAARTGEVIGARRKEIDRQNARWIVPAERMKSGREHIVPLSSGAIRIIDEVWSLADSADDFLFPGRNGSGLSQMTMLTFLQRSLGRDETCHGFRSTFKDWCGDIASVPEELSEAALAHVIADKTEAAYRRLTAVERRRSVMQQWCDFCSSLAVGISGREITHSAA